jgi:exonuclease III
VKFWCFLDDFNAVLNRYERKGASASQRNSEMRGFKEFVDNIALVDLPILGRRFTWYKLDDFAMSRIDRIMVSQDWLSKWKNSSLWALNREVSDHTPLILRNNNLDWGQNLLGFEIGG